MGTAELAAGREKRAAAAKKYRPSTVRLLLIAEAPPSASSRYFYFEDVADHDSLFRYVARGILGEEPTRDAKPVLLKKLHDDGVFLIDLQLDPRDGSPLTDHVTELVARARALKPEKIILIKATVYDVAFRQLREAGLPVVNERIPFPSSGQQRRFEHAFARALRATPERS